MSLQNLASKPVRSGFVVEQMVQCVFDGAGDELPLQVYREKARAGVNVFVTRHGRLRNYLSV